MRSYECSLNKDIDDVDYIFIIVGYKFKCEEIEDVFEIYFRVVALK
jgi:hypothetical protein